jgi:uncharacterized protein YjdB
MSITGDLYDDNGLFGTANNAIIRNVGFEGTNINLAPSWRNYRAGAVGGTVTGGVISNCYNMGAVSTVTNGGTAHAGGIAGSNANGTISDSYSTASVHAQDNAGGTARAGGIFGESTGSGSVSRCYNSGSVYASTETGTAHAGGIAGQTSGSAASISDCYNTGNISAYINALVTAGTNANAGGIAGTNQNTVSRVYNAGNLAVSASGGIGGIAGTNSGVVNHAHWNRDAIFMVGGTSRSDSDKRAMGVSGSTALNTVTRLFVAEMRSASFFTGFDFANVWAMPSTTAINNGFPVFRAQGGSSLGSFVPISSITGVPAAVVAGTNLTLAGTVNPSNATNRTIVWSIVSTSPNVIATLNNGVLNAALNTTLSTASGAVTVRAAVINGTSGGNFIWDYNISVVNQIPVTNITDLPSAATVGVPLTLTGTVNPANAANRTITWSLVPGANGAGAVLSGNTLTAASQGTVAVRATIIDGWSNSNYIQEFNIVVTSFVPVTSITGLPSTASIGVPMVLSGTVNPSNASHRTVTWTVVDPRDTNATIINGNVLNVGSVGYGGITLRATVANGGVGGANFHREFDVFVSRVFATGITGVPGTASVGVPLTLYGTVLPENASNKNITWTVQNQGTTGAVIIDGVLTATAPGTVIVRAANIVDYLSPPDCNCYFQDFPINVTLAPPTVVTNITGVPATVSVGVPLTLTGNVVPSSASHTAITWSVNPLFPNTAGASVTNDNTLTATEAGAVTVTATIVNGILGGSYTQDFTVTSVFVPVTSITMTPAQRTAAAGVPFALHATVNPSNASRRNIVWTITAVGDTGATIEGNILRTVNKGTVTVTAAVVGGGLATAPSFQIIVGDFIPVGSIIGVPNSTTAGSNLPLTGTVFPADASGRDIMWSINDAGATGATMTNNVLHTTSAGQMSVLATVANGTASGVSFWQVFNITVHPWSAHNQPPQGGVAPGVTAASDWAVAHINQAYGKGFIPIGLQGAYRMPITRGEFVHLAMGWVTYYTGKSADQLMREFGVTPIPFTDGSPTINAAGALGITAGVGGLNFGSSLQFDRQQAAVMLANVMKIVDPNYNYMMASVRPEFFADVSQASPWARDSINFMGQFGFMSGVGSNRFDPFGTFTREQSIIVFNQMG